MPIPGKSEKKRNSRKAEKKKELSPAGGTKNEARNPEEIKEATKELSEKERKGRENRK